MNGIGASSDLQAQNPVLRACLLGRFEEGSRHLCSKLAIQAVAGLEAAAFLGPDGQTP
jgi:hypothetical protein